MQINKHKYNTDTSRAVVCLTALRASALSENLKRPINFEIFDIKKSNKSLGFFLTFKSEAITKHRFSFPCVPIISILLFRPTILLSRGVALLCLDEY